VVRGDRTEAQETHKNEKTRSNEKESSTKKSQATGTYFNFKQGGNRYLDAALHAPPH
jgi:hypothetical protein